MGGDCSLPFSVHLLRYRADLQGRSYPASRVDLGAVAVGHHHLSGHPTNCSWEGSHNLGFVDEMDVISDPRVVCDDAVTPADVRVDCAACGGEQGVLRVDAADAIQLGVLLQSVAHPRRLFGA